MTQSDNAPRGGCGAAIAVITAVVVLVLVVAGLFLPPFSLYDRFFGVQYVALNAAGDVASTPNGSLRLSAVGDAQTGVVLEGTSLLAFTSARDNDPALAAMRAALPPYLALQSEIVQIQASGAPASAVIWSLQDPGTASRDVLDLYGYDAAAQRWQFIPSVASTERIEATTTRLYDAVGLFQPAPLTPEVIVTYDVTQFLTPEVAQIADIVAPAGLQPTLTGALTGSLAPGFAMDAEYAVMPIVRDFADPRALDTETMVAILGNSSLRKEHIRQLSSLVAGGFDGVWIDYRGIPADQRANFSSFITDLGASFDSVGLMLGVVIPQLADGESLTTSAYDLRAIGQAADRVQLILPLNPEAYLRANDTPLHNTLREAVSQIDRTKIVMGLSAESVRALDGVTTLIGYDEGLSALGNVVVDAPTENGIVQPGAMIRARLDGAAAIAGVDTRVNTPYLEYMDTSGQVMARIWLTTSDALRWRMDAGAAFAITHVAFDDLLTNDLAAGILATIEDYTAQIPVAPAPTDLVLRWRIEGTNGTLQEITTAIGETLETTLNAPDGNYAVNVAVVGIGEDTDESVRSGASVAMFAPTPTPTPLPTATPTPLPTTTPTPAPIIATAVPVGVAPSGNNFSSVAPGAGSIRLGQFEYGGHVTDTGSGRAIEAMRRAGMTWMKVQMRYGPGANAAEAAGYIAAARQNGFKILLGTVGNASDLANGGDSYISGYASWLSTIASLAPDAIEVWNEPNLDREWPKGQISGASYANMLRIGYSAIKRTNPSVIVISAAPGPTGAEAAYPGSVVNDDRWLADMVAAGGLGYADCVGVHYNEGIVPPNATSGDPRDNYYTRYFASMLETYWSITGGQKPLCFTELGYLSPEGFSVPLDPYFGWAQNVTVGQQAAWLAQAAALASQSGRVKLMIVWNVDFQIFGTDPMGGYAVVRPDGSCPACDTLASAR